MITVSSASRLHMRHAMNCGTCLLVSAQSAVPIGTREDLDRTTRESVFRVFSSSVMTLTAN